MVVSACLLAVLALRLLSNKVVYTNQGCPFCLFQVVNIPNSMTVLPELLPYSIEMAQRKLTGIMNYTNPGTVSHNEILEMYKSYIDPDFTWSNFSLEEQAKVIKAERSNNLLDTMRVRRLTGPLSAFYCSSFCSAYRLVSQSMAFCSGQHWTSIASVKTCSCLTCT